MMDFVFYKQKVKKVLKKLSAAEKVNSLKRNDYILARG